MISFDGTHLAYTIVGKSGPVVALCAGFCCPDNFWRYLVPALSKNYRVLIWNYRGCGESGMPREPGYRSRNYSAEDFTLDLYARDLKSILDHEQIRDVVLLGHSMGTQVILEAYRLMPERIRAMVSVTGPYASAFNTFYNSTIMPRVFPLISGVLHRAPLLKAIWGPLFRSSVPHPIAIALGALGSETKEEDMRPYYDHIAELDPLTVVKMADAMHEHTAEDLLKKIKVPTLVIVGERDNFTPAWLGHVMVSRIKGAELVTIPEGTHGTIVEEPKVVNGAIVDFLRRNVLEPVGTASLDARRATKRKAATPRPARKTDKA